MRAHIPIVTLVLLLTPAVVPGLTAATANAEVITVCWDGSGDYVTIQEGIDAASDGDEVVVCDGVYAGPGNKNLDFHGKAITVRSANGPDTCVIDCEGEGRGFYFHSGESEASVLNGFTIQNGYVDWDDPAGGYGGGIYSESASPTITDCTIAENRAAMYGAGMYFIHGDPTISDCIITGNEALGSHGGGIFTSSGDPTIRNCTIAGNVADFSGAGIFCHWASADTAISNCIISENVAMEGFGGGLCCGGGTPTIVNCIISRNTACEGGGVAFEGAEPSFANCTISANTAATYGGGVYSYSTSDPTFASCVMWGNSAEHGPQVALYHRAGATLSYCDIEGGHAGVFVQDGCTLDWGPGNIDADPLFVDPDDGDYRLSGGSPCIDAGCNWAVPADIADLDDDGNTSEYTPLDLDGEGRFFDDPNTDDTGCTCPPIVDMGAYEFGETGPQPCPGDLDCDRDVDESDLGILLAAWHLSADGDLNCDGATDHADLGILLAHWGEVCP